MCTWGSAPPRVALAAKADAVAGAGGAARYVLGYSTVPNAEVAKNVTDVLVGERLAACVSTVPGLSSTYLWQGKITTDSELLLMIKTRAELAEQVQERIKAVHPYDTPEFVVTEIKAGLPDYLKWIGDSTGPEVN